MCWSEPASLSFAATGIATGGYAYTKGKPAGVYVPVVYFSIMEILQFFSYFSINQCALESNTTLTFLSYLHVAFQPLFINMFFLATLGRPVSRVKKRWAYGISLLTTAIMLFRLIPINPDSICAIGMSLCGRTLCTISGNWHLAWSVPQYTYPFGGDMFIYYALGVFIVPLIYGAWTASLLTFVTGPIPAYLLASGNPLEWPTIWCLYSVALIIICIAYTWDIKLETRRQRST